jgi:adenylate kinase
MKSHLSTVFTPGRADVRVALLGPPGAGKSTQARALAGEWRVPHIATGDMLRKAAADTPLGREAKRYMDSGELVPDEVIIGLVADRLGRPDAARGFVLEGFPRTIAQAQALDRFLQALGQSLEHVVNVEVSEPELLRRLTARRVCGACGTTFDASSPPQRTGVCDSCGGELYQREDDRERTVRKRLDVYARQTRPLLDYYRGRGLLDTVSGEGPIETVQHTIRTRASVPRR